MVSLVASDASLSARPDLEGILLLDQQRLVDWASSGEAYQALLLNDGFGVDLEILDGSVLGDAGGGCTSSAPDGQERICLNASWLSQATAEQLETGPPSRSRHGALRAQAAMASAR